MTCRFNAHSELSTPSGYLAPVPQFRAQIVCVQCELQPLIAKLEAERQLINMYGQYDRHRQFTSAHDELMKFSANFSRAQPLESTTRQKQSSNAYI